MKLTDKEVDLVARAEKSVKRAKISRMIILLVLVVALMAMILDFLPPDTFAYFSFAVVVYAIFLPQLGGPPYDDLVALLIRIRSEAETKDPLIDALTKNHEL